MTAFSRLEKRGSLIILDTILLLLDMGTQAIFIQRSVALLRMVEPGAGFRDVPHFRPEIDDDKKKVFAVKVVDFRQGLVWKTILPYWQFSSIPY